MTDENKRIVEINGIKVEVDLRTAKRVDSFKVGDPVKVLIKDYSSYKPYPGIIIGFDEFQKLPTLVVAYLKESYSEYGIHFAYINSKTEEHEITPMQEFEEKISKNSALEYFDREIQKRKRDLDDVEAKKEWFIKNYQRYFEKTFGQMRSED